jgi:hypothetical protein
MKNLEKFVSILEITKMMHDAKSDLEREIAYDKWLKTENEKKSIKFSQINLEKSINEMNEIWKQERTNVKSNFLDLPLVIDKTPEGKIVEKASFGSDEYEQNIEYSLHTSIDAHTGKISIQYYGEDDSYLSHKEILKAIKIENEVGKYGK